MKQVEAKHKFKCNKCGKLMTTMYSPTHGEHPPCCAKCWFKFYSPKLSPIASPRGEQVSADKGEKK